MPRQKDDLKIEKIHKAALRIILEQGLSGLRMGDVAKVAGVATGTVYIYFKDKEELIRHLHAHLIEKRTQQMLEGYDAAMPFMSGFRKLWFAHLQNTIEHPEENAFLMQYHRSPFGKERWGLADDPSLATVIEILERGKREMLVRNAATHLLAAQWLGGIAELGRMAQSDPSLLTTEDREVAFKMAWDSIRA